MGLDCRIYALSPDRVILAKETLDRLHVFWPIPLKELGQGFTNGPALPASVFRPAVESIPPFCEDCEPDDGRAAYRDHWVAAALRFIDESLERYGPNTVFGIYDENWDDDDIRGVFPKLAMKGTP
jgi:hypothetical protein